MEDIDNIIAIWRTPIADINKCFKEMLCLLEVIELIKSIRKK